MTQVFYYPSFPRKRGGTSPGFAPLYMRDCVGGHNHHQYNHTYR